MTGIERATPRVRSSRANPTTETFVVLDSAPIFNVVATRYQDV